MGTSKLWEDGGGGTCDGLAFHPGEQRPLLVTLFFSDQDKRRDKFFR